MTVFDDGPVGEYPDIPARSGVAAVLDAANKMAAAVQAVAEIRAIHLRTHVQRFGGAEVFEACSQDDLPWPCPTVRVLERHGLC